MKRVFPRNQLSPFICRKGFGESRIFFGSLLFEKKKNKISIMTQLSDKDHKAQMAAMKAFDEQMPCLV
jgi:hypothetical protein